MVQATVVAVLVAGFDVPDEASVPPELVGLVDEVPPDVGLSAPTVFDTVLDKGFVTVFVVFETTLGRELTTDPTDVSAVPLEPPSALPTLFRGFCKSCDRASFAGPVMFVPPLPKVVWPRPSTVPASPLNWLPTASVELPPDVFEVLDPGAWFA